MSANANTFPPSAAAPRSLPKAVCFIVDFSRCVIWNVIRARAEPLELRQMTVKVRRPIRIGRGIEFEKDEVGCCTKPPGSPMDLVTT